MYSAHTVLHTHTPNLLSVPCLWQFIIFSCVLSTFLRYHLDLTNERIEKNIIMDKSRQKFVFSRLFSRLKAIIPNKTVTPDIRLGFFFVRFKIDSLKNILLNCNILFLAFMIPSIPKIRKKRKFSVFDHQFWYHLSFHIVIPVETALSFLYLFRFSFQLSILKLETHFRYTFPFALVLSWI